MRIVYTFIFITAFIISLGSCNKNDPDNPAQDVFEGEFEGMLHRSYISTGQDLSVHGPFKINADNTFILDVLHGKIEGNVNRTSNTITLTAKKTSGIFEEIEPSDISGTYNKTTQELKLNSSASGKAVSVDGKVMYNHSPEHCSCAQVIFSHNSACNVTVTINNISLGPITPHYHQGAFCDSYYDGWTYNASWSCGNLQSKLPCVKLRLKGLDGNMVEYDQCVGAYFVLAPNTQYSYTAKWTNGDIQNGTLTTGDSCSISSVCLKTDKDCSANSNPGTYKYLIYGSVWGKATADCQDGSHIFDDYKAYYTKIVEGEYSQTYTKEAEALKEKMKLEVPGQKSYLAESSYFSAGKNANHVVIIEYTKKVSGWNCNPLIVTIGYGTSYDAALASAIKKKNDNGGASATYKELKRINW